MFKVAVKTLGRYAKFVRTYNDKDIGAICVTCAKSRGKAVE